ncbi:MAG TPA: ABC transporter permease [Casimicrobiaceae bacterium]|nr:ABC transporter permease [Casimicrobiaceae bacterium]
MRDRLAPAKLLRLALRMLSRDFRAGELTVLAAALALAVGSMGTVGFFADRVTSALTSQAGLLLGADALISSDRSLPPAFEEAARARGLETMPAIRFNSMVQKAGVDTAPVLANVKAVADGYPLRGAILLADDARPEGVRATHSPPRGEAWPDQRLAQRLDLKPGDRLAVGEATLVVGPTIQQEPEIATGILSSGPRLLIHYDDLAATNLLQPGNRATWRLMVAEPPGRGTLADFTRAVAADLKAGQRLESVRDVQPEVRQTLDRAEQFLGLAALVAVILAAVAVALTSSRYLRRHLDTAAMLRCLGASERRTLALFATQFVVLGLIASAIGVALALGGQALLASILASLTQTELPSSPSLRPGALAFATGVLLLFGFALPPLLALASVPPLRVLRRDLPRPRPSALVAYALGAAVIGLLIGGQAQDVKTGAIVVGGVAALIVVAACAAWLLIAGLKRLPQRGVTWRFGLANLRRRPLASSLQVGALALGLMALLLLTVVRGDLMRSWRASLPPDAPNHFVINVLPEQVDGVRTAMREIGGPDTDLYPMVRGRLVAVNGAPLDTRQFESPRARRLAEREFNLSTSDELPSTNRIVAGTFWGKGGRADAGISMEEGIADNLRLKVGDELTFDIAGTPVSGRITSLRKVDWDSFRPNFFTLFPPGALDGMPTSWIGAVRVPEGPKAGAWVSALLQNYPNVLAIDVGDVIRQVQSIMEQVSRAVEFVFLFTLAGGLLVLQAAIAATQDERRFDAAILRTIGASSSQLSAAQVAEFLVLGALAGVLGAAGATAIGWALADRVFTIPYAPGPWVWVYGIVGGALVVALAGWIGTRNTARQPPLAVIRQLG